MFTVLPIIVKFESQAHIKWMTLAKKFSCKVPLLVKIMLKMHENNVAIKTLRKTNNWRKVVKKMKYTYTTSVPHTCLEQMYSSFLVSFPYHLSVCLYSSLTPPYSHSSFLAADTSLFLTWLEPRPCFSMLCVLTGRPAYTALRVWSGVQTLLGCFLY